jgi:hypothetical protein
MPGMVTKDEEEKILAASTALATREYRRGLQDGLNVPNKSAHGSPERPRNGTY